MKYIRRAVEIAYYDEIKKYYPLQEALECMRKEQCVLEQAVLLKYIDDILDDMTKGRIDYE